MTSSAAPAAASPRFTRITGTGRASFGKFRSALMLRIAEMPSFHKSTRLCARSSAGRSSTFGQGATQILSAEFLAANNPRMGATTASDCQICSVTNGTIGCSSRTSVSSTSTRTACATGFCAASFSRGLANSIAQSQKSFQVKSRSVLASFSNWNFSKLALAWLTVARKVARIQRSSFESCSGRTGSPV